MFLYQKNIFVVPELPDPNFLIILTLVMMAGVDSASLDEP